MARNAATITELDIRIWMRDNDPAANNLLDDYEFTPEELRTALTLAVDHWNDTPPLIGSFDYDQFPFRSLLLKGTAANLLFIAANRFRRNALKYTVPGGAVADQEKFQEYDGAGGKLWEEFKTEVMRQKRALNMEVGWSLIE
jgi:hypothetical protein